MECILQLNMDKREKNQSFICHIISKTVMKKETRVDTWLLNSYANVIKPSAKHNYRIVSFFSLEQHQTQCRRLCVILFNQDLFHTHLRHNY